MDKNELYEFINPLILFANSKYQFNKNLFNIPYKKYLKVSKKRKSKDIEVNKETKLVQDKYEEIKAEKDITKQFQYLQVLQKDKKEIKTSYSTVEYVEQLKVLLKLTDTKPHKVEYDEIDIENIYINCCVNNTNKDQILKLSTEEYYIPMNSSFILLDLKYWNRIKWVKFFGVNNDVV